MAQVQRQEVIQNIIERLRLDAALGNIPTSTATQIQAIINAEPIPRIQAEFGAMSDGTTNTIITTHATKKTYLTSVSLTVNKDVNSNAVLSTIDAQPKGGAALAIFSLRYEPLTANEFESNMTFPIPILLEPGTNIVVTNNSGTASIDARGTITYYEEEP